MRSNILLTLFILCYLLPNFIHTFQVTHDVSNKEPTYSGIDSIQPSREKREIEPFDNEDYPSAASKDNQEEPGFWVKVANIAMTLFKRIMEWLNSS